MARIENTVFISYRRTDVYTALAVYENLKNQGYDVFFDYRSIGPGDFEQIILSNIKARAHFIVILTATALDRCNEPGDWLRREIEFAIKEKRNIVPLMFKDFSFGLPTVKEKLIGGMQDLKKYNALNVHEDYFEEAMQRLREQYLNVPLDTVLHPVSTLVQKVVWEEQKAADKAIQELVKQADFSSTLVTNPPMQSGEIQTQPYEHQRQNIPTRKHNFWYVLAEFNGITIFSILTILVIIGIAVFENLHALIPSSSIPTMTVTAKPIPTETFAISLSLAETPTTEPIVIAKTEAFGIGSTMTGKDGMTLLYVPAGEFIMGSENGIDEKPVHKVDLNSYWIDQTEVTNKMYSLCVDAGGCKEPNSYSYSRSSYYGDVKFDNFPVVNVSWNDAKYYCTWVSRRLPTEAEWEKAARGENALIYPWGNESPNDNLLNYNNAVGDTTEVGKYPGGASPYGVLDMAGNVWEWVNSLHEAYPYIVDDGRENLSSVEARVLRGGSWYINSYDVRSSARRWNIPSVIGDSIGFRCAMDATP